MDIFKGVDNMKKAFILLLLTFLFIPTQSVGAIEYETYDVFEFEQGEVLPEAFFMKFEFNAGIEDIEALWNSGIEVIMDDGFMLIGKTEIGGMDVFVFAGYIIMQENGNIVFTAECGIHTAYWSCLDFQYIYRDTRDWSVERRTINIINGNPNAFDMTYGDAGIVPTPNTHLPPTSHLMWHFDATIDELLDTDDVYIQTNNPSEPYLLRNDLLSIDGTLRSFAFGVPAMLGQDHLRPIATDDSNLEIRFWGSSCGIQGDFDCETIHPPRYTALPTQFSDVNTRHITLVGEGVGDLGIQYSSPHLSSDWGSAPMPTPPNVVDTGIMNFLTNMGLDNLAGYLLIFLLIIIITNGFLLYIKMPSILFAINNALIVGLFTYMGFAPFWLAVIMSSLLLAFFVVILRSNLFTGSDKG